MTPANIIGERVKYLRRERGLTQRGLAVLADVSVHAISRCENARPEDPISREVITAVASALRVDPSYLVTDEDDNKKDAPATYRLAMRNQYSGRTQDAWFVQLPRLLTAQELATLMGTLRVAKSRLFIEAPANWDERDVVRVALEDLERECGLRGRIVENPVAGEITF